MKPNSILIGSLIVIPVCLLVLWLLFWKGQIDGVSAGPTKQDDGTLASKAVAALPNAGKVAMTRITNTPFRMSPPAATLCFVAPPQLPPHVDHYCHIFVNETALGPMKSRKGAYEAGSVIVKQKFSDRSATDTQVFTIMRKMEKGYDPENGDWEYSTVGPQGAQIYSNGRLESCIDCHQVYKDTDYISGVYLEPFAE